MLEEKDKKILRELMKNGRISFADLGRKCHMTRQSVFSRIKSLRHRGIIKNFTVNLDKKKLGLSIAAYILINAEPLRAFKKESMKELLNLPQIMEIHHIFGRYSYIMEVRAKDLDELTTIIKKIHEFPHVVRTETLIVYCTEKYYPQHPIEGILK
jgi:Lrp/AsnC family transcriptional regulator for asnA, asnC and gidA